MNHRVNRNLIPKAYSSHQPSTEDQSQQIIGNSLISQNLLPPYQISHSFQRVGQTTQIVSSSEPQTSQNQGHRQLDYNIPPDNYIQHEQPHQYYPIPEASSDQSKMSGNSYLREPRGIPANQRMPPRETHQYNDPREQQRPGSEGSEASLMKSLLSQMFEELAYYNSKHPSFSSVLERLINIARGRSHHSQQRIQTEPSVTSEQPIFVPFSTSDSPCGTANFPSQSSGLRPRSVSHEEEHKFASGNFHRTNSINKVDFYVPTESSLLGGVAGGLGSAPGSSAPQHTHQSTNLHYQHASGSSVAGFVLNAPLTEKKIQVSILENQEDFPDFQSYTEGPQTMKNNSSRQPQLQTIHTQNSYRALPKGQSAYQSNRNPAPSTFLPKSNSTPKLSTQFSYLRANSLQQCSSTSFGGQEEGIQYIPKHREPLSKTPYERNHYRFESVRSRSQQMRAHRLSIKWKQLQKAQLKLNRGKQALKAERKARIALQEQLTLLQNSLNNLEHKVDDIDRGGSSKSASGQSSQPQPRPRSFSPRRVTLLQNIFGMLASSDRPLQELNELKQLFLLSQNLSFAGQITPIPSSHTNSNPQPQFASVRTSSADSPLMSRQPTAGHIFTSEGPTPSGFYQQRTGIHSGDLITQPVTRDHSSCTTTLAPHSPLPSTVVGSRQISPGVGRSNDAFLVNAGGQLISKLQSQIEENLEVIQLMASELEMKQFQLSQYQRKLQEQGLDMETEEEFDGQEDQVKNNLKSSEIEFAKKSRNTLNKRGLVKLEEGKESVRRYRQFHPHHNDLQNIESGGTLEYRQTENNIYLSHPSRAVVSSFDPHPSHERFLYTNLNTNTNTPGLTSVPTRKVTATNTSRAYSRQMGLGTTGSIELISCCSSQKSPMVSPQGSGTVRTSSKLMTPTGVAERQLQKAVRLANVEQRNRREAQPQLRLGGRQYSDKDDDHYDPEFIGIYTNETRKQEGDSLFVIKEDSVDHRQLRQQSEDGSGEHSNHQLLTSEMLQSVLHSVARTGAQPSYSRSKPHHRDDQSLKYSPEEDDSITIRPFQLKAPHLSAEEGSSEMHPTHLQFSSKISTRATKSQQQNTRQPVPQSSSSSKLSEGSERVVYPHLQIKEFNKSGESSDLRQLSSHILGGKVGQKKQDNATTTPTLGGKRLKEKKQHTAIWERVEVQKSKQQEGEKIKKKYKNPDIAGVVVNLDEERLVHLKKL